MLTISRNLNTGNRFPTSASLIPIPTSIMHKKNSFFFLMLAWICKYSHIYHIAIESGVKHESVIASLFQLKSWITR